MGPELLGVRLREIASVELALQVGASFVRDGIDTAAYEIFLDKARFFKVSEPLIHVVCCVVDPLVVRNPFRRKISLRNENLKNSLIGLCQPIRWKARLHESIAYRGSHISYADTGLRTDYQRFAKLEIDLTKRTVIRWIGTCASPNAVARWRQKRGREPKPLSRNGSGGRSTETMQTDTRTPVNRTARRATP